MSHVNYRRNYVAKELREDEKYRQRVVPNKRKYDRKKERQALQKPAVLREEIFVDEDGDSVLRSDDP